MRTQNKENYYYFFWVIAMVAFIAPQVMTAIAYHKLAEILSKPIQVELVSPLKFRLQKNERVSIFCNRTTKQITFNLKNRNLKIFAQDPENVSTGEENITCEYIGEEINIGFNSDYLKEVINKQEEGTIDITMKNPVSAALFKNPSINKNEMISLLMPIRIND